MWMARAAALIAAVVIGLVNATLGLSLLAIDAGRTLLFDRDAMIRAADDAAIAIAAFAPDRIAGGGDEPQKSAAKRKS